MSKRLRSFRHLGCGSRRCPKCGRKRLARGFGLAGGGFGAYTFCGDARCGWSHKPATTAQSE